MREGVINANQQGFAESSLEGFHSFSMTGCLVKVMMGTLGPCVEFLVKKRAKPESVKPQ